jgi:hypothetical protein
MRWKLPPKIEILQALSSVAADRVRFVSSDEAEVKDSEGKGHFSVVWKSEKNAISSNDSGSMYAGHLGYPAIAFLMILGVIPYDMYLGRKLAEIPWKDLKDAYKDHRLIINEATKDWGDLDKQRLEKFVDWILKMLESLDLVKLEESPKTLSDFVGKE